MRAFPARGIMPILLLLLAAGASACAPRLHDVTAADIPRLEEALQSDPEDIDLRTRLGVAHYRAGNHDQARTTLGRAVEDGATSGAAFLHLGLANEELGNWTGAREAYSRYIEVGRFDPLKDDLRNRLEVVIRNELREEARQALALETDLARSEPGPRTIAVFPFRIISEDADLEPLTFALADMMITDLALSGALTVLERTRVQSLLDEMALAEAGYTAPESGARVGRLLRAEHVVQGALTTLGDENLRFDADVLHTVQGRASGAVTNESALARLFDLEKEAVFEILDVLGVDITPAEREAINERWTENLLAFIAYGSGLRARDEGRYAEAATFFQEALRLDPSFAQARARQMQSEQLEQASSVSPEQLALRSEQERDVFTDDRSAEGDLLRSTVDEVNPTAVGGLVDLGSPDGRGGRTPTDRNPTQEASGLEGVTSGSTFTIILRILRPGAQ